MFLLQQFLRCSVSSSMCLSHYSGFQPSCHNTLHRSKFVHLFVTPQRRGRGQLSSETGRSLTRISRAAVHTRCLEVVESVCTPQHDTIPPGWKHDRSTPKIHHYNLSEFLQLFLKHHFTCTLPIRREMHANFWSGN
jgi:hypothetical protein